ncbi:MAG: hypothetical protein J0L97_05770 [Alphaproteobacteria bacterium]|nr:hypothetical protein [Alphaproteobacteria bacterium]
MPNRNHMIALTGLFLAACSVIPDSAYVNRGQPENLIDVSSERVNVRLASAESVDEVISWVNQDQPTRAEIICLSGDQTCQQAQEALSQFAIPVKHVEAADNSVTLIYDRVLARDCNHRFVTNHINPYNLNHSGFGCSTAVNMLQMVSDKQQFVNPNLLDMVDGDKAASSVKAYNAPVRPPSVQSQFKDDLVSSQQTGN